MGQMGHAASLHDAIDRVSQLSQDDFARFREWFTTYDAEQWDRQIESDAKAGKLSALVDEALKDHREGRSTDL